MANQVLYAALMFLVGWLWYFLVVRQFVFNFTTVRPMLNRFKKLSPEWNTIISINSFRYLSINIIVWILISAGLCLLAYYLCRNHMYLFISFLIGGMVGVFTFLGRYSEYTERNFKDFCSTYYRFVFDDELRTAMFNSKVPAMKKRMEILNLDKEILIHDFKN